MTQYEQYKAEKRGNKPRSVQTDVDRVKRFFGRSTGHVPKEPTPATAEAMYSELTKSLTWKGKLISAAEHQLCLKAARRFGNWLVKRGIWRRNPLVGVEPVGRANAGKQQLTRDQEEMFVAGALACFDAGDSAALAAVVCARQGVRASEIASRRVSHLDEGGRVLHIPEAKSARGVRNLPIIDEDVREALQVQAQRAREWARRQNPTPFDPPLFPPEGRAVGQHLSPSQVLRAVHRVCKAVGLPEVCTHSLRGCFASRAAAQGLALEHVAAFLGNAPAVTARHYATEQAQIEGAVKRAAGRKDQ